MKINKSYLEQLIIEQMQLMENIGGSSFFEPLTKSGALLIRILKWYGGSPRERRANPITVSMNDFENILKPYFNKWIFISMGESQFCGQLVSFDVAASSFPRLVLNFENAGFAVGDSKEEYRDEMAIQITPRGQETENGYLGFLVTSLRGFLSLPGYRNGDPMTRARRNPSDRGQHLRFPNIIIEKNGNSDLNLIASDQASFKFMEELGANPSINAGVQFLRDLVVGDGGDEISTLHRIQVLGLETVFSKEKTDIFLSALEEYIERGELNVEATDYES